MGEKEKKGKVNGGQWKGLLKDRRRGTNSFRKKEREKEGVTGLKGTIRVKAFHFRRGEQVGSG